MKEKNISVIGWTIGMIVDLWFLSWAFSVKDSLRYYMDSSIRVLVWLCIFCVLCPSFFSMYMIYKTIKGESTTKKVIICPSCGASVTAGTKSCWRCHHSLTGDNDEGIESKSKPKEEKRPTAETDTTTKEEGNDNQLIEVYMTGLADQLAKINVIRVVRGVTGLGLADAKRFVENPPSLLKATVSREEADEIKELLESAGALVEFRMKI